MIRVDEIQMLRGGHLDAACDAVRRDTLGTGKGMGRVCGGTGYGAGPGMKWGRVWQ